MMDKIKIDSEFESLIVPLKTEEFELLEESILNEGLRVPIDVWKGRNILIDGHHRLKICEKHNIEIPPRKINRIELANREEVIFWMIQNQMARRNLTKFSRCELAYKFKPILKKITEKQVSIANFGKSFDMRFELAKLAGVGRGTMEHYEYIRDKIDEKTRFELTDGETRIYSVCKKIKEDEEKEEARAEITDDIELDIGDPKIWPGTFEDLVKKIEDESIDAIITDPPYAAEYSDEWDFLGTYSERILKPSGFLITYSGKFHLPKVIKTLSRSLEYYWQMILIHSGVPAAIHPQKINTQYKPILIFQKPPTKSVDKYFNDVLKGSGKDKSKHEWQQSEDEFEKLVKIFTKPNDMILDPFAGSGTTLIAAKRLNRNAIGIEPDKKMIGIIKKRIKDG